MKNVYDELYRLRKELEDQIRYKETALHQLDKIDEALPEWKGTGIGRIDAIQSLREENARLTAAATKKFRELPNMKGWLEAGGDALMKENMRLTQEVKFLELRIADFEQNWILRKE